jgi:hypothetical protein
MGLFRKGYHNQRLRQIIRSETIINFQKKVAEESLFSVSRKTAHLSLFTISRKPLFKYENNFPPAALINIYR